MRLKFFNDHKILKFDQSNWLETYTNLADRLLVERLLIIYTISDVHKTLTDFYNILQVNFIKNLF